jgi:hypothetical protein
MNQWEQEWVIKITTNPPSSLNPNPYLDTEGKARGTKETTMIKENFNWNPFTLLGETPSGLRFKTEFGEGDPDFATKEDLEIINANPQLLKAYKAVISGANKKFQERAENEKKLLKTIESLQSQVGELDGGLQEWENMYSQHKDAIDAAVISRTNPDLTKGKGKGGEGDEGMWEKKFNQLVQNINQVGTQIEKRLIHQGRMLSLSMQLNDLYRKNPQMDGEKVLDAALKGGETDLTRAYNDVYHDEILNKEVETRLTPRLEEELQKRQTQVETGSGATPLKFEIPKETPKTWVDAGQEFLKERAAEAAKP